MLRSVKTPLAICLYKALSFSNFSHHPKKFQSSLRIMLTISPPLFSYPLGDLRRHEQNGSYHGETETSESLLNSPTFQQQVGQNHESHQFSSVNDQSKTVKKLNHNASERDRRKRINGLYSSLRSLLPPAYQEA